MQRKDLKPEQACSFPVVPERFPATDLRRYTGGVALQVWVENELCALRRWAFIVVVVGCRFVLYATDPAVDASVVADVVKLHRNPL